MFRILKEILASRKPILFNLIGCYYVICTDLTKYSMKLTFRKKETEPFDLRRHFFIDKFYCSHLIVILKYDIFMNNFGNY
jgi:hypothetical protein